MIAWAFLLLAGALVFYIIAGYPLLLASAGGRRRGAPAKDPGFVPTVSVLLAVHNGAAFLRAKLESLLALDYPGERREILVVSDGSTDDTETIARAYENRGVRLLRIARSGKAAALNHALASATGEILFFTDVRQPLDRMALRHLVANFADPVVGGVTGELRILRGDAGQQADMDLYWRYELWARRRHSEIDSVLVTTGCLYAVRRNLVEPLPEDTLTDDAVLPMRIFFRGYRVVFDPAAVAYDYPVPGGTEFRRRFRTLAGLWQVHARLPQLFTAANRMRWHFFSHKSARLVLPWAILTAVAATFALPASPVRTWLLVDEAAFFALAGLDLAIPKRWRWVKRISSPARTFLTMNVAALAAIAVFLVPASRLWRPSQVSEAAEASADRKAAGELRR